MVKNPRLHWSCLLSEFLYFENATKFSNVPFRLTFAITLHSPLFGHITLPFGKSTVFEEAASKYKNIDSSKN